MVDPISIKDSDSSLNPVKMFISILLLLWGNTQVGWINYFHNFREIVNGNDSENK